MTWAAALWLSASSERLQPSGCEAMRAGLRDSVGRFEAKMTTRLWAE